MYLYDPTETVSEKIERLTLERDVARARARGFASGFWLFDTTDPPEWLFDRFDENGEPCDADGNPVPAELSDPRLF